MKTILHIYSGSLIWNEVGLIFLHSKESQMVCAHLPSLWYCLDGKFLPVSYTSGCFDFRLRKPFSIFLHNFLTCVAPDNSRSIPQVLLGLQAVNNVILHHRVLKMIRAIILYHIKSFCFIRLHQEINSKWMTLQIGAWVNVTRLKLINLYDHWAVHTRR